MPARSTAQKLTLFDRLSHLTYAKACRLLGSDAKALLTRGGAIAIDLDSQVKLTAERLQLQLGAGSVTIELGAGPVRLIALCDGCGAGSKLGAGLEGGKDGQGVIVSSDRCEHVGAALSLVLEEKTLLGLAAPPPERRPVGSMEESQIVERALAERQERAASRRNKPRFRPEVR